MADKHLCVAIYENTDLAEEAFTRLKSEGSTMDLLSFVGRDEWKCMLASRNAGDRFVYRGARGPFWARLWSGLNGWGVFWIFENGPMLVAGPLVRTIVANQEEGDGVQPATLFESAFAGIGIPCESLVEYERALMHDQVLIFVQGTLNEIYLAQDILNKTKPINHTIHHNGSMTMKSSCQNGIKESQSEI